MQKTTNKDEWFTDVLRKDQLNKTYIMKLVSVSVSIIPDNSCFEHTNYVKNGYHVSFPLIVP